MSTEINWQLTNLELSKKLKELGVPQKSSFYWVFISNSKEIRHKIISFSFESVEELYKAHHNNVYSAFTVSELGMEIRKYDYKEIFLAYNHVFEEYKKEKGADAQLFYILLVDVDFVAKMLIYLIENKLICTKN